MEGGVKLATGGDDIRLWDIASCSTLSLPSHQFSPHSSGISSLCWNHNNQILASAGTSGDKVVLTFIKNAASNIVEIAEGEQQTCVAFNSTSRYLLTGGRNRIVSIWDLKSKKLKKTYTGHKDNITCTTFNWNDTYIASGSASGEILLHNVISGQTSSPLITPKVQSIRGLGYSQFKKSLLASVSDDGSMTLWDTNARKPLSVFKDAHRAPATALAFSPVNDMLLMSTGLDKRILCYDVPGKSIIKSMTVDSPLTSVDCMHDGATIAVGSTRGKVYMFDLRMGSTPFQVLDCHKSSVQCVQFQHRPTAKTNGVNSKVGNPVLSSVVSQKPTQGKQGVIPPSVYGLDGLDSLWDGEKLTKEDTENQDIISPIREGSVLTVKSNNSLNHSDKPDSVAKATGTPSHNKDSLPDFFSPLSENSTNISTRRTPIGTVQSNSPYTAFQTASFPNEGIPYRGVEPVAPVNRIPPVGTDPLSRQPTLAGNNPSLANPEVIPSNTRGLNSPGNQRSQSCTTQSEPSLVGANTMGKSETDLFLRSPVNDIFSTASVAQSSRKATGLSEPGTHQLGKSSSPRRGLLKGSPSELSSGDPGSKPLHDTALSSAAAGEDSALQPFQVHFIKNMIDDSLEEFKESFHREILHLQREMVRQFQIQQVETQTMLEKYSINEGLLVELERLREENKKLKATY